MTKKAKKARKAKKETWEIDIDEVTLDDLILLEEGSKSLAKASELRELLGRLVKNKSAKQIGKIPLAKLWKHIDTIGEAIKDTIPKENDTPS